MADSHHRGLTRSVSGILESSKYSDLTVRCGADEFKLHRAIVCPRSEFFAAACDGPFQEVETSTIVLKEDDPPTARRMFTYLYTLAYDDEGDAASAQHYMANETNVVTSQALTTNVTPVSAEELLRHAKMMNNVVVYAIAQKYDIDELKELATAKFRELLWLKAPGHGLPDIIDAVFQTTSLTDSGLRDVSVEFCTHYSTNIIADDHLCGIIKDHGELGLEVLRGVDKHAKEKCQQKDLLHGKLVTLKGELAKMIKEAAAFTIPTAAASDYYENLNAHNSLAALRLHLRTAHDNAVV
ncbi:hypothetical protein IMSHALPRED_008480 [Imshaugia aleurites]|uniref:BTB domain-containing protein n=1 Tax=Imshaugia aleurites TaxID=172621 RepID=A0A8H3ENN9_9LECA|nr:hypothetical protein IMSHALPRED_008480 [Imshaugia aleurites]